LANTAMRWTISHLHFAVILMSHMVRSFLSSCSILLNKWSCVYPTYI
jgi:hypothetical protein